MDFPDTQNRFSKAIVARALLIATGSNADVSPGRTLRFAQIVFATTALAACFLVYVAVFCARAEVGSARKVFAHYMVAFPTYGMDTASYLREMKEAQALGIDGFVLNVAAWSTAPTEYQLRVRNIFAAALQLEADFTLFFSADMCCGLLGSDIVDMMTTYGSHPSYLREQTRPVLTTFMGEALGQHFWQQILKAIKEKRLEVFFVPAFFVRSGCDFNSAGCDNFNNPSDHQILSSYNGWWKVVVDGLHYFAVAGTEHALSATGEAYARVMAQNNKIFVAGISPYFWEGRLSDSQPRLLRRYYETHGGEGIQTQWHSIMSTQRPRWVIIETWNDYTESYMSPADPDQMPYKSHFYNAGPLSRSHIGYAEFFKYYIRWFKSGRQPSITSNALYFFYRTHPKNAFASNDVQNVVQYGNVEDNLYITTMLTSSGMLRVTTGGIVRAFPAASGITNIRVPFSPGAQSFDVIVGDQVLLHADGDPIDGKIIKYNFTTTSGFVSSSPRHRTLPRQSPSRALRTSQRQRR
jgi:glucan endo-1,3-alpha-glucosidase